MSAVDRIKTFFQPIRKSANEQRQEGEELINQMIQDFRFPNNPKTIEYKTSYGSVTVETKLSGIAQQLVKGWLMCPGLVSRRISCDWTLDDAELSQFPIIYVRHEPETGYTATSTMTATISRKFRDSVIYEQFEKMIKEYNVLHSTKFFFFRRGQNGTVKPDKIK